MQPLDVVFAAALADALARPGPGSGRPAVALRAALSLLGAILVRAALPDSLEVRALIPLFHAAFVLVLSGPRPTEPSAAREHDASTASVLILGVSLVSASHVRWIAAASSALGTVALWLCASFLADELARAPEAGSPPRAGTTAVRVLQLGLLYWAMMGLFNLGWSR